MTREAPKDDGVAAAEVNATTMVVSFSSVYAERLLTTNLLIDWNRAGKDETLLGRLWRKRCWC